MVFQNKFNVVKYFLFFVLFFSFFVFSDTYALTVTQNVEPTGNKWSFSNSMYQYTDNNSASWTNANTGYISLRITSPVNTRKFIHAIRPTTKITVKKDYYYQTTLGIFWAYSDGTNATNLEMVTSHMTSSDFDIISWTPSSCIRQDDYLDVYPTNTNINDLGQDPVVYVCFDDIVLKAKHDGEVYFQLGSGSDMFLHAIIPFKASIQINDVVELNPTDATSEINEREKEADSNIESQSTSDIGGSENQATTNLIGVFSSFLTELQSFSATSCTLSLPFPQFIGGTQNVNICQGKDVLGNFITVIGTLAMVGFYIPLAIVLIKMIYNEIRSFTNG